MTKTERRSWTRLPTEADEVVIETARGIENARPLEDSFGGMSLVVGSFFGLPVGKEIRVHWNGAWTNAIIRNVTRYGEDFRLGVEWAPYRSRKNDGGNSDHEMEVNADTIDE